MLNIVSASQMQSIDRRAIESFSIPGLTLMENAGQAVVARLKEKFPDLKNRRVSIFCGTGNNGGDGFVIARLLGGMGATARIFLAGASASLKGDAETNARRARSAGIAITELGESGLDACDDDLRRCDIVIDAVFGTGLTRPAGGLHAQLFDKINAANKYVVAVDVPSGAFSDTGALPGPHLRASLTVALGLLKVCHVVYPAAGIMGEVRLADIGLPPGAVAPEPVSTFLIDAEDVRSCFKRRRRDAHKGVYGHALVIAGSRGKGGAAGLASLAALRVGAGLVTLATPESCARALEFNPLETMSASLPETDSGTLDLTALDIALEQCRGKSAVALGPGLGTHERTAEFVKRFLRLVPCPVVIDADALNCLAAFPEVLREMKVPAVLTPHPKEMSRLNGKSLDEVLERRLESAIDFAVEYKTNVILKSAHSCLAFADGSAWVNPLGNPGMATAGTGDVLTGMVAGLLAQGFSPQTAAICASYIHGLCGDIYASVNSETSLIAGDLLRTLPEGLKRILP